MCFDQVGLLILAGSDHFGRLCYGGLIGLTKVDTSVRREFGGHEVQWMRHINTWNGLSCAEPATADIQRPDVVWLQDSGAAPLLAQIYGVGSGLQFQHVAGRGSAWHCHVHL